MGYTIYYRVVLVNEEKALRVLEEVCTGLGLQIEKKGSAIVITPECTCIEPLIIKSGEWSFSKTYKKEPYTSLYKLILLSLSSFGSVELFDDEGFVL